MRYEFAEKYDHHEKKGRRIDVILGIALLNLIVLEGLIFGYILFVWWSS